MPGSEIKDGSSRLRPARILPSIYVNHVYRPGDDMLLGFLGS